MTLALFDLDNTLLSGDSDYEWTQHLLSKGILDRETFEARNQEFYEQYKAGKDKAFNALVGQVMKASKGKANPQQVNELLKSKLA